MIGTNATIAHLTGEKEEQILLARVLDQGTLCDRRHIPTNTPFLSPRMQQLANSLLLGYRGRFLWFGGYPGAERQMLFFLPDYLEELDWSQPDCPICALQTPLPKETPLSHRDFLGALLGAGIARDKLGDIVLTEDRCTLLLHRELESYVREQADRAGRARLHWSSLPLSEVRPPVQNTEKIQGTVLSLRLDAVCALGFSISRTKAAGLIAAGLVFHNHAPCQKPEQSVSPGDVISARGYGKFLVENTGGVSRKGRTFLHLKRYR